MREKQSASDKSDDEQRNHDAGEIGEHTADESMSQAGDSGDAEIEGEHIDDGFAAASHHAGGTTRVGVRTHFLEDIPHKKKGAAAGNGAQRGAERPSGTGTLFLR